MVRVRLLLPVAIALCALLGAGLLTPGAEAAGAEAAGVEAAGVEAVDDVPWQPSASLAAVAARNDMSVDEAREILDDDTARLDATQRLYFEEPDLVESAAAAGEGTAATGTPEPSQAPPYDLSQTFALHSRPTSSHVIVIDVDGGVVSGTSWNANGLPTGSYRGYSLDADFATFTDEELTAIQEIWQRVSEDYAPFDVDVTTGDPGLAALTRSNSADQSFGTRALVSNSSADSYVCTSPCGGVAYIDSFDQVNATGYYQPAWVFPHNLANSDTKAIAEAVSHEVGHNFGLHHDGISGSPGSSYYGGHGSWAPIMGNSYNRPITQWSRGEYAGATNTEDDLAIIAAGGAPRVADEAGDTVDTAATDLGGLKLITSGADRDVFALGTCAGTVQVSAAPTLFSVAGQDLDVQLELLTSTGGLVTSVDPASATVDRWTASGMSASLSAAVPADSYFVRVDGVGNGTASNGYTGYASIGSYVLTASCGDVPVTPATAVKPATAAPSGTATPAPTSVPSAPRMARARNGRPGGRPTAQVSWTGPASDGGATLLGYRVQAKRIVRGAVVSTTTSPVLTAGATSYAARLRPGTYRFVVVAVNSVGTGPHSARSQAVVSR